MSDVRRFATFDRSPRTSAQGPGCVKTPASFQADPFRSLFRALRLFRSEKITKNFALRGRLQNFAEFSHSLGRFDPFAEQLANDQNFRTTITPSGRFGSS